MSPYLEKIMEAVVRAPLAQESRMMPCVHILYEFIDLFLNVSTWSPTVRLLETLESNGMPSATVTSVAMVAMDGLKA